MSLNDFVCYPPGFYYFVYRVSSSLLGPGVPSFRALSGRLKFTVRRHKFNGNFLSLLRAGGCLDDSVDERRGPEEILDNVEYVNELDHLPRTRPVRKRLSIICSSYTKVYSVIYDSGSVPDSSIFSPRETSPTNSESSNHE